MLCSSELPSHLPLFEDSICNVLNSPFVPVFRYGQVLEFRLSLGTHDLSDKDQDTYKLLNLVA